MIVDERLDTLVIARCSVGSRKPRDVVDALGRFAPADVSESSWRDQVLQRLERIAAVDKNALAARIGKHTARRWPDLANRVLPLVALGAPPDLRPKGHNVWAAAIVARAYGVWNDGAPPTQSALGNAFVWQVLGIPGKPKSCPAELRAHFLGKELGANEGSFERQLRALAAAKVGAPRGDARMLTRALVRMWLVGRSLGHAITVDVPFARRVLDVARGLHGGGLFGDRKAFIGAVFDASTWSMSLAEFKSRLIDEHRAGRLELARADYVSAMDPDLVRRSELSNGATSFHFIVREDRR